MRKLEVDLMISLSYNLVEFVLCTKVSDFLSILGDPSNAIFTVLHNIYTPFP